jgi:hypothetical protein
MKLLPFQKFLGIVVAFLGTASLFLFISCKLSANMVYAQVPAPYEPCNSIVPTNPISDPLNPGDWFENEYHSLRPYQASPCNTIIGPTAQFCGNNLTFHDTINETYPGKGNCTESGDKVTCTYDEKIDKPLTIDLSNANLPFMGNTGDDKEVINSQNRASESLSAADKVNQYVSWYLNGVNYRAEYPFPDVSDNCVGESTQRAGICLNKSLGLCAYPNSVPLLPDIPDPLLIPDGTAPCGGIKSCCVTINPLAEKVDMTDRDKLINYSGPLNKLLPQEVQQQARAQTVADAALSRYAGEDIRHDQIVACTYGFEIPLIGKTIIGIPAPCYEEGIMKLIPRNLHRASEWLTRLPPVRSDYKSYIDFQVAYSRWRGRTCIKFKVPEFIPLLGGKGIFACGELVPGLIGNGLFHPNFFAQMYAYIPMSSTEDLEGSVEVDSVSSATSPSQGGVTVTGVTFSNQTPATLFFSHMEETSGLANILQDSYVSKDEMGDKAGSPTNVSQPASCTSVEVRSNKGDDLFATQIEGDLHYEANFTCEFNKIPTCSGLCFPNQRECFYAGGLPGTGTCLKGEYCCDVPGATPEPVPAQDCTKDIYISLSTSSNTPKVDDIWSRLVAGPQSVFKRIFPKTNTPGSVGQIIDIPGSTNIIYTGLGISQQDTDLKFPHVGGISEYFLKGIQTALRPKGFGEPISFAQTSSASCADGTEFTFPPTQGDCALKSNALPGISTEIPPTLKKIVESAGSIYKVPPGLILGIMYGEGLFDGGNKKDWTEDNVLTWACQPIPGCSETGDDNLMGFNGSTWDNIKDKILPDLQKVDPGKTAPDRCILLDAIYGLAWNLHDSADGGMGFSCFGINLNAPSPTSCDWTPNQYESAIKVSESGYTNMCLTKENSCATGGGTDATCPNGDTCETISNRYSQPSHNGCVWDVAHKY